MRRILNFIDKFFILNVRENLILLNVLNFLDLLTTIFYLKIGMYELNPIMIFLFKFHLDFLKLIVVLIPSIMLNRYSKNLDSNDLLITRLILFFGNWFILTVLVSNFIGFILYINYS